MRNEHDGRTVELTAAEPELDGVVLG